MQYSISSYFRGNNYSTYTELAYKDIYKAGKTSMVSKAVKVITKSNTSFNAIEDVISIPLTSIDDLANVPLVHLIREKLSLESGVKLISRICHDIVICIPYDNIYSVDYLIKQLYIRMRSVPTGMTAIFAFRHFKKICTSKSGEKYIPVKDEFNSNIYSFEAETARIDITDDNNWDVINNNGSESYPIFAHNIIIPRTFHTSLLPELAKRYRGGRFPIVCWKEKDTNCFLLRSAYMIESRDDKYLVQLDECRWLQMISKIIQKAVEMALIIAKCSASVIASFEDGQDFTAQVTSLTQLLLDPYYRTMDGFQVLIQKEWSEIGHPFCKRNLPFLRRDKEAEGPVFIQWLDCVYQIVTQFPYLFEFTPNFLHDIAYHVYSCRFGTFLSNDVFDDEKTLITEYKELCNTLDIKFDKKLYIDAHLNNNERCLAELFQIKPIRKVMLKKNERNINLEYEEEDNPQSWKTAPNIDLHYSNESLTDSNGTPDNSLRRQTINFVYILQRKGSKCYLNRMNQNDNG
ncbi:uncharacterized protein TRIADDRAFT_62282 [Trichoplax adhaerens]|uniref:Myotubularin phosphatase domain-containing protein n=1 Tax=Trichoplax adhaerens TaxID=10228 RepID=B3SDC5_TRIAD|nr:hypothetical protein TRIADDRAFT_62282 [Trichoplax adhaerens]EDV19245.1 hypothetical protein TRIADDRAFT_62282 [Trichoplax adhaerens]|eukprot:XP_002118242.1 hypothetical protein TRIADDRAFT_62282 [Trichoplax adhaerens]